MKIELCAASIEAIQLAKEFDFDRIELCQNLEQGGLTPSPGQMEYALAYGQEVHVLIRPRPGGFIYSTDEIEIILRDIREAKSIGVHGVVVGVLDERSEINEKAMGMVVEQAKDLEVTFHRAFDDTISFEHSLTRLVDVGVTRVLSSGLSRNIDQGITVLKDMMDYSNGRIEVMAGGGVNSSNMKRIVEEVKPDAVHFSGTKKVMIDEGSYFSESVLKVDKEKVKKILEAIDR